MRFRRRTAKSSVAIIVRLKNGTNKTQFPHLVGTPITAVTDDAEHSLEPYDGGYSDVPGRNVNMLPGAAVDFALTFHVPKSTVLKDLVYCVDCPGAGANPPFRVSLKE